MMIYKTAFLFFLISNIVLLISCGTIKSDLDIDESKELVEINMNVVSDEKKSVHEIVNSVNITQLETNSNCFITHIDKVEELDGRYIILDNRSNNLLMFNKNGEYIQKIGDQGHGPGEYIDVADFCIDRNRKLILVLSIEKTAIYEYCFDGEYENTVNLSFQSSALGMLGSSLLAHYIAYYDPDNTNLKITTPNSDEVQYSYFEYPESTFPMNLLAITGNITSNLDGCLYSDACSSYIHQILPDGRTYPKYRINFQNSFWPEEDKYELQFFFNKVQLGQLNFLTNNYEENEQALVFGYNKKVKPKNDTIIRRQSAFYLRKTKKNYNHMNLKNDFLYSVLSEPVGITKNGNFIYS